MRKRKPLVSRRAADGCRIHSALLCLGWVLRARSSCKRLCALRQDT